MAPPIRAGGARGLPALLHRDDPRVRRIPRYRAKPLNPVSAATLTPLTPPEMDHGWNGWLVRWLRTFNGSGCASRPPDRGAIRARPHLCPGQLGLPESPHAGPQAAGLPALAQRPRTPPRRPGRPAPRAGPHPRRTPAMLGPPPAKGCMAPSADG